MKGSTFESFLDEAGIKDEAYATATKRVIAHQLKELMDAQKISKSKMAKRMETSRPQLDRLLDPRNARVQLDTIQKAAAILGCRVRVELVEIDDAEAA